MEMLIVCVDHSIDKSITIGNIVAARYERGLQHFFQIVKIIRSLLPHCGSKGRSMGDVPLQLTPSALHAILSTCSLVRLVAPVFLFLFSSATTDVIRMVTGMVEDQDGLARLYLALSGE